jgi:hypothetical protein
MDYPGEKVVLKLWDSLIDRGVSALLRPWSIRRDALASAEAARIHAIVQAQTRKDVLRIENAVTVLPQTETPEKLTLPRATESPSSAFFDGSGEASSLALRAAQARLLREELNIANAIMAAEEVLKTAQQEHTPESIDEDWLEMWREGAAKVSTASLQSLWGRLLAGEAQDPGQFSLRTIAFLRNLSGPEAKLIERIAPFVIDDFIFSGAAPVLREADIHFHDLLQLEELGFLHGIADLRISTNRVSLRADRFLTYLAAHDKVIVIEHRNPGKEAEIPIYSVTKVGKEILSLGTFTANEQMLAAVKQFLDVGPYPFSVRIEQRESIERELRQLRAEFGKWGRDS